MFVDQSKQDHGARLERSKPSRKVDQTISVRKWNRPDVCAKTRVGWRLPRLNHSPEEDGDGIGDGGIKSVWPACNFSGLSMWLNFCSSLTLMLCIRAMEVSVSPRATMWLLPSPAFADGSGDAEVDVDVADVDAEGAPSPIMTPGRWLDSCD